MGNMKRKKVESKEKNDFFEQNRSIKVKGLYSGDLWGLVPYLRKERGFFVARKDESHITIC